MIGSAATSKRSIVGSSICVGRRPRIAATFSRTSAAAVLRIDLEAQPTPTREKPSVEVGDHPLDAVDAGDGV